MLLETLELESAFPLTGGSQLLPHRLGDIPSVFPGPCSCFEQERKGFLPQFETILEATLTGLS